MFLAEICSTSWICHFMFLRRHWSHIQTFEAFIKRIGGIRQCPSFPKLKTNSFWNFAIYTNQILNNASNNLLILWGILILVSPKKNNIGSGGHGHVHQVWRGSKWWLCELFSRWILKVTSPKWSRITLQNSGANRRDGDLDWNPSHHQN